MGLYDRFYDEDSKCPKCNAKITIEWLTKQFECLMETWKKGDIVQYRRLEEVPEGERKRGYGKGKFAPSLRKTDEYLGDKPLLLNGKVPFGTNCGKCEAPAAWKNPTIRKKGSLEVQFQSLDETPS